MCDDTNPDLEFNHKIGDDTSVPAEEEFVPELPIGVPSRPTQE